MLFVDFLGIIWPEEGYKLLLVSVRDVQRYREHLATRKVRTVPGSGGKTVLTEDGHAPKTINRRISSISSFYKYLAGRAADARLPINVPNPAHVQFVPRERHDVVEPRRPLTATRARQLMGLPKGESVLDYRDRALIKTALYTGVRIGTLARFRIEDFDAGEGDDEASLRLLEKGNKRRVIGVNFNAADAIKEYLRIAAIEHGPLFRARRNSRSEQLSERPISTRSIARLLADYFRRLPGAERDGKLRYVPHSLRATVATLLDEAGEPILEIQRLLGHRHVTTTQGYIRVRDDKKKSASHRIPL
jgi:integrase